MIHPQGLHEPADSTSLVYGSRDHSPGADSQGITVNAEGTAHRVDGPRTCPHRALCRPLPRRSNRVGRGGISGVAVSADRKAAVRPVARFQARVVAVAVLGVSAVVLLMARRVGVGMRVSEHAVVMGVLVDQIDR